MITWRTQYAAPDDPVELAALKAAAITPIGDSMTQQHYADDANINTIMRRFGVTDGALPPAAIGRQDLVDRAYYGDFSDAADLKTQLDRVNTAFERFDALPADIRSKFRNDPVELLKWIDDPRNADEAVTLKLLSPVQPAPTPKPAIAATTTAAPTGGATGTT